MIKAALWTVLCLILFPASLAAQPALQTTDPGKAEVLTWLGGISEKMLSCRQVAATANEKLDLIDQKKIDAPAAHADLSAAVAFCFAVAEDIGRMKIPASITEELKTEPSPPSRSCPLVMVAAAAQVSDRMEKDTSRSKALLSDERKDKRSEGIDIFTLMKQSSDACLENMRYLARKSGASDAEIRILVAPLLEADTNGGGKP